MSTLLDSLVKLWNRLFGSADPVGMAVTIAFVVVIVIVLGIIFCTAHRSGKACSRRLKFLVDTKDLYDGRNLSTVAVTDMFLNELRKSQDSQIRHAAILFNNGLLRYRRKSDDLYLYCNRRQAEDVFCEDTLAPELFYGSSLAPSVLTGLGVLGTFTGLLMALIRLARAEGSTVTSATSLLSDDRVQAFMSAASTAFITSICGVTASIFASIYLKHVFSKYRDGIRSLCNAIDESYPPNISPENGLSSLDGVIESDSVQSCIERMNESLVETIERTSEQTAKSIADQISGYLKVQDDRTAAVIRQTLDKLRDEISHVIEGQTESIRLAGSEYVRSTREATSIIGNKYADIAEGLKGVHQAVVKEVDRLTGDSGGILSRWDEAAEKVTAMVVHIDELAARLDEQGRRITASDEVNRETLSRMRENVQLLSNGLAAFSSSCKTFCDSASELERVGDQISSGVESMRKFSPEIARTVDDVLKMNRNYAENWAAAYDKTIRTAVENLSAAVDKLAEYNKD